MLLDECLPCRLVAAIDGHTVSTVQREVWAGVSNGRLLAKIAGSFDALVTVDQNLPAQHNLSALPFGVIVLRAQSNRLDALTPLVPDILFALSTVAPGQIVIVEAPAP